MNDKEFRNKINIALETALNKDSSSEFETLQVENARLKAEHDKAVEDIKRHCACRACKYRPNFRSDVPCNECNRNDFYRNGILTTCNFVWEGLEELE